MAIEQLTKNAITYNVTEKIIMLLEKFDAFSFRWVARERNAAANYLARYALNLPSPLPEKLAFLRQSQQIISFDPN